MRRLTINLSRIACAILLCVRLALEPVGAVADEAELDRLFGLLKSTEPGMALEIERQIVSVWSDSGSPAMNLLLQQGREAMAKGNLGLAVSNFSVITEQAPSFAEGWNARATAYYFMGRFDLSVADIQRTLTLNPRHFGAITGFAMILETIGEFGGALRAYQAVRELHPNRPGLNASIDRLEKLQFESAI